MSVRKHIVQPPAVDHQIHGRPAKLHRGAGRNRVEDCRIGRILVDAEGGDVLAAVVASHGEPALEQHDEVAPASADLVARRAAFDPRMLDQLRDGVIRHMREKTRALELGGDGFHGAWIPGSGRSAKGQVVVAR